MRFELALYAGPVVHAPGDTLLLPVPEDERPLRGDAGWIDWRLCGEISRHLLSGCVTGKSGEAILFPGRAPLRAARVLLLGVGPRAGLRDGLVQRMMGEAAGRLRELQSRSALLALPSGIELERSAADLLRGLVLGLSSQRGKSSFRLVIPDGVGHEESLEAAMAALLPEAHARGVALEVGWVSSGSERDASDPALQGRGAIG